VLCMKQNSIVQKGVTVSNIGLLENKTA